MSSTEDDPVLHLENVSAEYADSPLIEEVLPERLLDYFDLGDDPVEAIDDVSFELDEEDELVLVGESGSGKSTIGRAAIGLKEPVEGTIRYRGHDIQDVKDGTHDGDIRHEDLRRALRIVHQDADSALNPYRTVRSTLSQPLKLWYPEMDLNDRRERIRTMLETIDVAPAEEYMTRYPHELSGGEKQRITIIRAMLVEPDVILADEVVSALDVSLRIEIMDLLLDLQEMFGTSYIFISHNLTNARYFAEKAGGRIAVMYLGNIVEIGPVTDVLENPKHPYTKILKWASLPIDPQEGRAAIPEEAPVRRAKAPDPTNPPSGCRFHPVCPKARTACEDEKPSLTSADGSTAHVASCFREVPDHEYWDSSPLDGEEIDIQP